MSKLDKEITLQTTRGYAEVNRITEAERRARLKEESVQEPLETFVSLYETWEQTGKRGGGNWEAITQRRLDAHLLLRRAFEQLAKKHGLTP